MGVIYHKTCQKLWIKRSKHRKSKLSKIKIKSLELNLNLTNFQKLVLETR